MTKIKVKYNNTKVTLDSEEKFVKYLIDYYGNSKFIQDKVDFEAENIMIKNLYNLSSSQMKHQYQFELLDYVSYPQNEMFNNEEMIQLDNMFYKVKDMNINAEGNLIFNSIEY